jgi:hypothetical protein
MGAWGFATVALALNPPRDGPSPLIFAALLVVGAALFFRQAFSLKRVFATENGLFVSNYRRELFVPYEQIAGIRENKLISSRPITVELRSAGPFGRSFVFVPCTALVLFSDHPVATRLRQRAAAARKN